MGGFARLAAGRRTKWVVIAAWLLAALATIPLQSKLQALASDESDAFRDRSAESTRVGATVEKRFPGGAETTAVIVYTRDGPLQPPDAARVAADAQALCASGVIPDISRLLTSVQLGCGELPPMMPPQSSLVKAASEDQSTVLTTLWTRTDATEVVMRDVATMRKVVPDPNSSGLRAYVTGEAGFAADASLALEGTDTKLLVVTLVLVLVLLLLTYRSPVLAVIPLVVVGLAYIVAAGLVYAAAQAGAFKATGQATAILIVLMFGAGTDYCLLLVARYREELREESDPHAAMTTALRRTGPAIVSAGAIVVAVMLVLGIADYNATRWMGPVLAIGTAVTVLAGVTLLPALLVAVGTRAVTARRGQTPRLWPRIGRLVRAHPAKLGVVVVAVLAAGALGNLKDGGTLDFSQQFRTPPESVEGMRQMQAHFPVGQVGPVDVVVDARAVAEVLPAVAKAPGVFTADLVGFSRDDRLSLVRVLLDQDPFTDAATDVIPGIRRIAATTAKGRTALVGGPTAEARDSREGLAADARLIVPLALALIFVIVAVLLRSLVAPLYVIATVILSYAFALGVSALAFPNTDPAQPLFTFVFLVALGVDYNVFLLTRIREARRTMNHGDAVITGLERTGGVITSAGLILAGTFCTLLALELESLFQVGFTVALGLLVDTFLVRILLVPSIALVLGSRAI
jgi:RND superfamily putative drug exporter